MAQQIKKKYIEDGAIDGDKLRLLVGQALVQETANGVVELIKQQSSDGKIYINGKEAGFKEDLDQEVADRIAGDTALQANIDAEAETRNLVDQQLQSDLNSESSARSAADVVLQGNIDTEAASRVAADSTLQSNIDAEASARSSADTTLQSNIDSEASTRASADSTLQSNIDAEESARISGDASLQNQINDIISNVDPSALDSLSEIVSAFQAADSDLQASITTVLGTHTSELAQEVSDREAADNTLQSNIDSEESARIAADSTLQSNIDSEESSRISGDAALQSQVDSLVSAKDSMQSELDSTQSGAGLGVDGSYSPNGVSNYISLATSLKDADDKLDAQMKVEYDARVSADSTLQSNIDSEESARISADNVLQSNIDSEESARIAADSSLQSSIDQEVSDRQSAVSTLQSNLDSEESSRISGDANLQAQIDDILSNTDPAALDSLSEIVSAFQSADNDLQTAITNVLGTHTSELATETSARQSADSALSGRLDVLEAYEFKKEKMVLSATDISNGYVDLGFLARDKSIRAFVGRLAMHEGVGEDYTVSPVGGVSRVTFVGNMVSPSEEQLVEGDVLHFSYEI